ncbi:DUF1761 domain-containing protein [Borreliella valaisiana]|uniref:Uncharacterized protein n=2 Tax=Borreliella TaxID=64895 RepID=D6RY61_BORVA|nr:DUF1761 domain-containing protein [Borreliella valaisiana]AIJ29926.1 hypothetical protein P613_02920 [Borreliella valaisiana Tom4006]EEF81584.1 conserved hypothetical protein [Borreliella valaisiana VS116]WKC77203.1 DUF1761 domain-containing protein [Borreliella valaisiana]WLN25363.1 DUF1761 domain-containing protein [Borreliella valaisiana]WVN14286.1 DUF1761 domain-containing protein [Borreliella valaisiana]
MLVKFMFSNINLILILSMTLFKILLEIIYRKILLKKIIYNATTSNAKNKQYKIIIIVILTFSHLLQSFLISALINLFNNLITLTNNSLGNLTNLNYNILSAILISSITWLAFSLPKVINDIIYEKRPFNLTIANAFFDFLIIILLTIFSKLFLSYKILQFENTTNINFENLPTH